MADILSLQLFAFEVKQAEGILLPGLGVDEKSPRNRAHKEIAMMYNSHKIPWKVLTMLFRIIILTRAY